jgi:hypothetical protein
VRTLAKSFPVVLVLSACASLGRTPAVQGPDPDAVAALPSSDTLLRVDTVVVEAPGKAALEERLARLQLRLLERDAVIDELRRSLDAQRQEVVRNMAKLQNQATRAEAASGMAEAELALQSLAELSEAGAESGEHERAEMLLRQASAAFEATNFGGALYLANEARVAATSGSTRIAGLTTEGARTNEVAFAVPVPLATLGRSNVREGPGLSHPISVTLDPGVRLTGLSYTTEWVRVTWDDGAEGWIFHTLVASAEPTRP